MSEKNEENIKCKCPYCEHEIEVEEFPFCSTCNLEVNYCKKCGMPIPIHETICPTCGENI